MIGILDSGIGGVTVLNHIRKLLKHQHSVFGAVMKLNCWTVMIRPVFGIS